MIFTIIMIIFGAGFYSYTIGSISTMFGNSDSRSQKLQNSFHVMDEFCKETKIS